MSVLAKICGLRTPEAVTVAVTGGADFIGFVFYPPSPRAVSPGLAAGLGRPIPTGIGKVGLFVDASDDDIAAVLAKAPLDMLQLHGAESPERVTAIKDRFGLPTIKAIKVAERADIDLADTFDQVADWLLFDAKAPKTMADALPGGNGLIFDWNLLAGRRWASPWMLSGGLDADNLAEAVAISGAPAVDVSSGVEASPGTKDPARISAFLKVAKGLA